MPVPANRQGAHGSHRQAAGQSKWAAGAGAGPSSSRTRVPAGWRAAVVGLMNRGCVPSGRHLVHATVETTREVGCCRDGRPAGCRIRVLRTLRGCCVLSAWPLPRETVIGTVFCCHAQGALSDMAVALRFCGCVVLGMCVGALFCLPGRCCLRGPCGVLLCGGVARGLAGRPSAGVATRDSAGRCSEPAGAEFWRPLTTTLTAPP